MCAPSQLTVHLHIFHSHVECPQFKSLSLTMKTRNHHHMCPQCGECFIDHHGLRIHVNRTIPCSGIIGIQRRLAKRRKTDAMVSLLTPECRKLACNTFKQDSNKQHPGHSSYLAKPSNKSLLDDNTQDTLTPKVKDVGPLLTEVSPESVATDFIEKCGSPDGHSPVHVSTGLPLPPFCSEDATLTNHLHFQLDLQNTLNKHCVPLGLFDEVIDVVKRHSFVNKLNFTTRHLTKREYLVKNLKACSTHTHCNQKMSLLNWLMALNQLFLCLM